MTNEEYQQLCSAIESRLGDITLEDKLGRLLHMGIGLCTEAGEFFDIQKRHIYYQDKPHVKFEGIDIVALMEELGDSLWYIAGACNILGITITQLMEQNIEKLNKKRYKAGKFSIEEALNRNLAAEREALEKHSKPLAGMGDG